MLFYIAILLLFSVYEAQAQVPRKSAHDIIFSFYGTSLMNHSIHDKLVIKRDGMVFFNSIAPTLIDKKENIIGTFSYKVSKNRYSKLLKLLKKSSHHYPPLVTPPLSGMLEELSFSGQTYRWRTSLRPEQADEAIMIFKEIALESYKYPVQAMALQCSKSKKSIKCSYKNTGSKLIKTVHPLGVDDSILCLKSDGKKILLHETKEYDPRKMKPKTVKIKPGKEYSFSIKYKCDDRIVVRTTNMLLNKDYKKMLLGELISNKL